MKKSLITKILTPYWESYMEENFQWERELQLENFKKNLKKVKKIYFINFDWIFLFKLIYEEREVKKIFWNESKKAARKIVKLSKIRKRIIDFNLAEDLEMVRLMGKIEETSQNIIKYYFITQPRHIPY